MTATDLDDLFAGDAIADPYPPFAQLRELGGVHWNARHQLWVITSHAEVVKLVRNHDDFSSAVIWNDERPPYPPVQPDDLPLFTGVRAFRADQLVEQDCPAHRAMRGVVHEYFTPTSMEKWRPFVRAAVANLIDDIEQAKCMDVLHAIAAPLPVQVIAEMMGVPSDRRDQLRELADKLLYINRGEPDRLRPLTEGIRGIVEFAAPFVDDRIERPGKDFISVLAGGERAGVFNRHQVLVNTALLLFAGHETTMNLICNGVLSFMRHRDQWDKLVADPVRRVRLATEECLRFDPPVKSTQRIAARDVELGGQTIRKGDRIRWIIAAANRDPLAFDAPDTFDITRQPNLHVSFGGGIHYCLGATLARIEGQEVFRALAQRLPGMTLDADTIDYQPSIQFRSVKSLPVRWS